MGLPVVDQLVQQPGITPEELENLSEQMNTMFQDIDMDEIMNSSTMMEALVLLSTEKKMEDSF